MRPVDCPFMKLLICFICHQGFKHFENRYECWEGLEPRAVSFYSKTSHKTRMSAFMWFYDAATLMNGGFVEVINIDAKAFLDNG